MYGFGKKYIYDIMINQKYSFGEKEMKKNLKTAGILFLVIFAFDIAGLMLDIFYYEFSVLYLVFDSISVALSLVTSITYLCLLKKSEEYLLKHKKLFLGIMIANIFNGFVAWILTFWIYFSFSKSQSFLFNYRDKTSGQNTVSLDEDSYEEKKIAQDLTERLEELLKLRDKKFISEEEYQQLREQEIKKHFS